MRVSPTNDDKFLTAQRFPVHQHEKPACRVAITYEHPASVDSKGATKTTKTLKKHAIGLHIAQYLRPGAGSLRGQEGIAFRELVQNLFDEMARANGASYDGITMVEGDRKHGIAMERVICFHNGKVRLAEIVINNETTKTMGSNHYGYQQSVPGLPTGAGEYGTVTFINYGTVISNVAQVLSIGNSSKIGVANQVGIHGEGLKTAILRFIRCGAGVDIYCCVNEWSHTPVAQKWKFFVSTDVGETNGILCLHKDSPAPQQWIETVPPVEAEKVRFQVSVYFPKRDYVGAYTGETITAKMPHYGFAVSDYVLDTSLIRNRCAADDAGFLVPDKNGSVWVYNFHVFSDKEWILFGYNLFTLIGRERNMLDRNMLTRAVGTIWNAILLDPKETVLHNKLCDVLFNARDVSATKWIEFQALEIIPSTSRNAIIQIYRARNPTTMPIPESLLTTALSKFPDMKFRPVVQWLYDWLTNSSCSARYLLFAELVSLHKEDLIRSTTVVLTADLQAITKHPLVIFKNSASSELEWTTDGPHMFVNLRKLETKKDKGAKLTALYCNYLPQAYGDKYDITRYIHEKETAPPAAAAAAVASVPSRKRIEPETPAAAAPAVDQCPFPIIPGKKWRRVWTLE